MDDASIQKYVDRYEAALARHGYSPQSLCGSKEDRSDIRFAVLAQPILDSVAGSVLDIGCGFADLLQYLKGKGWNGRYTGVDIVPGLLREAAKRHPDATLLQRDASRGIADLGAHDFVIASGALNLRLPKGDNEAHIISLMRAMFDSARVCVAVDFMTTHVDFRRPDAWHTDPLWAIEQAQKLTRRVSFRADYMPYEFAIFLYKDATKTGRRVYRAFEDRLTEQSRKGGPKP